MAVLALGSPAKAAGSAQGSVRRVENKVRRQSEPPGSGCGASRPGLAVWGCPLCTATSPLHTLDGSEPAAPGAGWPQQQPLPVTLPWAPSRLPG